MYFLMEHRYGTAGEAGVVPGEELHLVPGQEVAFVLAAEGPCS